MSDICEHCGFDTATRNPSGYCDHLYYPDCCDICKERLKKAITCPGCASLKAEVEKLRCLSPEELLRQNDGSFPVGNGCELVELGTMQRVKELKAQIRTQEVVLKAHREYDEKQNSATYDRAIRAEQRVKVLENDLRAVLSALQTVDMQGAIAWIRPPYQAEAVHETAEERIRAALSDTERGT